MEKTVEHIQELENYVSRAMVPKKPEQAEKVLKVMAYIKNMAQKKAEVANAKGKRK